MAVRQSDRVGEADVVDRMGPELAFSPCVLRVMPRPHVLGVETEIADVGEHLLVDTVVGLGSRHPDMAG